MRNSWNNNADYLDRYRDSNKNGTKYRAKFPSEGPFRGQKGFFMTKSRFIFVN